LKEDQDQQKEYEHEHDHDHDPGSLYAPLIQLATSTYRQQHCPQSANTNTNVNVNASAGNSASFQCDDAYISLWPASVVVNVVIVVVVVALVVVVSVVVALVVVDSPSKSGNSDANVGDETAAPSTLVFRLQFDP